MAEVIPFYRPIKRPKPAATSVPIEDTTIMRAGDLLREVLGHEENILDVLVMVRTNDGQLSICTNLADETESIAFIARVEFRVLQKDAEFIERVPPQGIS